MNQAVNQKAAMTEMERRRKKNEMLNYFVDRRKKKKPSALIRAKMLALEKKNPQNKTIKKNEQEESEGEHEEEENENEKEIEEENEKEIEEEEKEKNDDKMELTTEHTIFDFNTIDDVKENKRVVSGLDARNKIIEYITNGQQIDPYWGNHDTTTFVRDYVDHFICKHKIIIN